jgi:myosin-5
LLVQAQLLSETQIADNEKQAYVVAQATNEQLTKKLEDAEKKVDQLQDSVQRFVTSLLVEVFGVLFFFFFFGGGGGGGVLKKKKLVFFLKNFLKYLQFCPLLAD